MLKNFATLARGAQKVRGPLIDIVTFNEKAMASSATKAIYIGEEVPPPAPVSAEHPESKQNYQVYKRIGLNNLHLNLEDIPNALQRPFMQYYLEELENEIKHSGVTTVQVNNLTEEAYRYSLNMPIRKLGYGSYFSRYNHEKGQAVFEKRQDL